MYQNLNHKNFFDSMKERFPLAMEAFCNWIDEYKKEIDWNSLFGNDVIKKKIKFHDIPLEMQVGIIFRHINDCHKNATITIRSFTLGEVKEALTEFFKHQEQQLCITKTSSTQPK